MMKFLNLVWKIPVAVMAGGLGYIVIKNIVVYLLTTYAIYLNSMAVVIIGTFIPLAAPAFALFWAFSDFILPPKPPTPPTGGGYIQQ